MITFEEICTTYNLKILGEGKQPIVFAHGLGCDQNVWQQVSEPFLKDYKVVLFDYIGSGESDLSSYNCDKYSSLHGYADDIIKICTVMGLREVIFVGHSVSGMIGLLAAIKQPALFANLVMIGASPYYINEPPYMGGFDRKDIEFMLSMMKENYIQWAGYFAPKAMGNDDRPELSDTLKNNFCKADADITCEFAKVTFLSDNRKDLSQLKVPSLILQPADDIVAPKHIGEYLNQNMANSTLYCMQAKGHFPHLSDAKETVTLINKYLGDR